MMSSSRELLAMLIKRTFWDYWDNLLYLTLYNIALFVGLGIFLFGGIVALGRMTEQMTEVLIILTLFVGLLILLPPALSVWLGSYGVLGERISRERGLGFYAWFSAAKEGFWPALTLVFPVVVVFLIFLLNIVFHFFRLGPEGIPDFLRYIFVGFFFWLSLILITIALIAVPFRLRGGLTVKASLARGCVITLQRPGLIIGLWMLLLPVWIIGTGFKLVGLILFLLSLTPVMLNSFYDLLMEEGLDIEEEDSASTWEEINAREAAKEKKRMDEVRYNRTFRDILKPWED